METDPVVNALPNLNNYILVSAFCNAAAILFMCLCCVSAVAVYFVLEPFVKPILWATLAGTILFPLKSSISSAVKSWLSDLEVNGGFAFTGVCLMPFYLTDAVMEFFYAKFIANGRIFLLFFVFILTTSVEIVYNTILILVDFNFFQFLKNLIYIKIIVATLYVNFTYLLKDKYLPLIIARFVCTGFCLFLFMRKSFILLCICVLFSCFMDELVKLVARNFISDDASQKENKDSVTSATSNHKIFGSYAKQFQYITEHVDIFKEMIQSVYEAVVDKVKILRNTVDLNNSESVEREDKPLSFDVLLWLFIITLLVKHVLIFWVLPLPLTVVTWKSQKRLCGIISSSIHDLLCSQKVKDVVDSRYVRKLKSFTLTLDRHLKHALQNSIDNVSTILLIVVLLMLCLCGGVFIAVQIHSEVLHLTILVKNAFNQTLHSDNAFTQWLIPQKDQALKLLDTAVNNGYQQGREFISSKLKSFAPNCSADVEENLLMVWDDLYNYILHPSENLTLPSPKKFNLSLETFAHLSLQTNLKEQFLDLISNNLSILKSVADSLWLLIKRNTNILFSLSTSTLSFVAYGGTAFLNFMISSIIFFTTLFYLLSFSDTKYVPIKIISDFAVDTGNTLNVGTVIEQVVASVFLATFRKATFYFTFTCLTHVMFSMKIIFIPSVLAMIFAAVPFVGTYWVSIPGFIELWLFRGNFALAVLFFVMHYMPVCFIDSSIYRDVKGGVHPYLIGLSVAGGVYFLGLDGAVIGPITLACLLSAINVFRYIISLNLR